MTASVIIPTYKRPGDLKRVLESISMLERIPDEVLVVVGPNDPDSYKIAKSYNLSGLKCIDAQFPSLIHAMNRGLAEATSDIVCFLDDDAAVPADWLTKIISAYEADVRLGAYGGRDRLQTAGNAALSDPPLARTVGKFRWNGSLVGNHHCGAEISPVDIDVLKGVNLSLRLDYLIPRLVDPALIGSGAEVCSEIDLCMRIKRLGYRVVYDNENWVIHHIGTRVGDDDRTAVFSTAWTGRTFNVNYVAAKFLAPRQVVMALGHAFLIGSRFQPGILRTPLMCVTYGFGILRLPFARLWPALRGVRAGRRARNDN